MLPNTIKTRDMVECVHNSTWEHAFTLGGRYRVEDIHTIYGAIYFTVVDDYGDRRAVAAFRFKPVKKPETLEYKTEMYLIRRKNDPKALRLVAAASWENDPGQKTHTTVVGKKIVSFTVAEGDGM